MALAVENLDYTCSSREISLRGDHIESASSTRNRVVTVKPNAALPLNAWEAANRSLDHRRFVWTEVVAAVTLSSSPSKTEAIAQLRMSCDLSANSDALGQRMVRYS